MLKLKNPINFNKNVKPIKFTDTEPKENENAKICGWGLTEEYALSPVLLCVKVSILNPKICKDFAKLEGLEFKDDHICAGDLTGMYGTSKVSCKWYTFTLTIRFQLN